MITNNLSAVTDLTSFSKIQETLLIVDDNPVLRDSLADILRLEGFETIVAINGAQAIAMMEVTMPDLVLSDIAMPVMDGIRFYREVRRRSEWQHIPFVFLTAYSIAYEIEDADELSHETVLVKPVEFEQLIAAIRSHLNGQR